MTGKGSDAKDYMNGKISLWQNRADDHMKKQLENPFSDWNIGFPKITIDKNHPEYGRPLKGSLTEKRAQQANKHIYNEIVELCHIIKDLGKTQPDGSYIIRFKQLFDAYTRISHNLVGMLVRARKQGFVKFEGEMLYQGRDDNVMITCVHVPDWP